MSEVEYKELKKISSYWISKLNLKACPEEIVNEAYILSVEENEMSFSAIKSRIGIVSNRERFTSLNTNGVLDYRLLDETKYCKKCDEDKPIASYGLTFRKKTNSQVIQPYCKSCQSKMMKAVCDKRDKAKPRLISLRNYHLKKNTEQYKKYRAEYMRDYYKRNKLKTKDTQ